MNNPEKLATWGTQDTVGRQTKQKTQHRKLKDEQHELHQKPEVNPDAREGEAVLLLIRHLPCYSYDQYVLDTTIHTHTNNWR